MPESVAKYSADSERRASGGTDERERLARASVRTPSRRESSRARPSARAKPGDEGRVCGAGQGGFLQTLPCRCGEGEAESAFGLASQGEPQARDRGRRRIRGRRLRGALRHRAGERCRTGRAFRDRTARCIKEGAAASKAKGPLKEAAKHAKAGALGHGAAARARHAAASQASAGAAKAAASAGGKGAVVGAVSSVAVPVAGVLAAVMAFLLAVLAISQIVSALFGFWQNEASKASLEGLPPYITYEMVEESLACQEEYGHPAGCTLAQIIVESGQGDHLSGLATQDHNLFGMKWSSSYALCEEVAGKSSWRTGEEYGGEQVTVTADFISFVGDAECIRFRSRVFLQASRYADNALIREAVANHDSDKMAEGLKDAGWATSSSYVESLKSALEAYNLYRFDGMSVEDLQSGALSADAVVSAAYSQLGVPYVWGGTTPGVGLDCSGLTQYCYRQAGISIPRNTESQYAKGKKLSLSEAQPGDILYRTGHVGIYIGGDRYIHAPHRGEVVKIDSGISSFTCALSYR